MFVGQILVVAGAIPQTSFTNSPVEPEHFQNMLLLGFGLKPTFFGSFSIIFPWFSHGFAWIEIHPMTGSTAFSGPLRKKEPEDDSWGPRWSKLEQEGLQAISSRSTEKQRGRIYHLEIFGCRHGHRNEYEKWDKDGLYIPIQVSPYIIIIIVIIIIVIIIIIITHIHIRIHIHIHIHIHTYIHTYIHPYIHTYIHIYIYTHTYIYINNMKPT